MTPEFPPTFVQNWNPRFEEILRSNLLQLVKDHRAKCDEHCNVSLTLIMEIAVRAGMAFDAKERELFL